MVIELHSLIYYGAGFCLDHGVEVPLLKWLTWARACALMNHLSQRVIARWSHQPWTVCVLCRIRCSHLPSTSDAQPHADDDDDDAGTSSYTDYDSGGDDFVRSPHVLHVYGSHSDSRHLPTVTPTANALICVLLYIRSSDGVTNLQTVQIPRNQQQQYTRAIC